MVQKGRGKKKPRGEVKEAIKWTEIKGRGAAVQNPPKGLTFRSLTDGQQEDQAVAAAVENAALIFLHEKCSVRSAGVRSNFSKPTRPRLQRCGAPQRTGGSSVSAPTPSEGTTDGIGRDAASRRSAVRLLMHSSIAVQRI